MEIELLIKESKNLLTVQSLWKQLTHYIDGFHDIEAYPEMETQQNLWN